MNVREGCNERCSSSRCLCWPHMAKARPAESVRSVTAVVKQRILISRAGIPRVYCNPFIEFPDGAHIDYPFPSTASNPLPCYYSPSFMLKRQAWLYAEASWRRMFFTQPAIPLTISLWKTNGQSYARIFLDAGTQRANAVYAILRERSPPLESWTYRCIGGCSNRTALNDHEQIERLQAKTSAGNNA